MNRTSYKTKLKGNLDILSLDAISQKSEGEYRIKCGNSIIDTFIFPPEKPTKKFYIYRQFDLADLLYFYLLLAHKLPTLVYRQL